MSEPVYHSYTMYIRGMPPFQVVACVDLTKQYADERGFVVTFKDESGEVFAVFDRGAIIAVIKGAVTQPPAPEEPTK